MPGPGAAADLPSLEELPDVRGRRVLVRADFNVPMRRGEIISDLRIRAATPTLRFLSDRGAHVTVCTHLGRPGGRRDATLSLEPVRQRLYQLVPGVELLDNLRFDPGEESNDPAFVEQLVAGHDLYVNDAFASLHRRHASVMGPPARMASAAGRLVRREVELLHALRHRPRRPFLAILAGEPAEEHPGLVRYLLGHADWIVLAGAAAKPAVDGAPDWAGLATDDRLVVATDSVTSATGRFLDTGRRTAERIASLATRAGTVFWDGPLGVLRSAGRPTATEVVADAVQHTGAFTVVSGVSTFDPLDVLGLSCWANHVSTGGAATMAFLRDGDLPGLAALRSSPGLA